MLEGVAYRRWGNGLYAPAADVNLRWHVGGPLGGYAENLALCIRGCHNLGILMARPRDHLQPIGATVGIRVPRNDSLVEQAPERVRGDTAAVDYFQPGGL